MTSTSSPSGCEAWMKRVWEVSDLGTFLCGTRIITVLTTSWAGDEAYIDLRST